MGRKNIVVREGGSSVFPHPLYSSRPHLSLSPLPSPATTKRQKKGIKRADDDDTADAFDVRGSLFRSLSNFEGSKGWTKVARLDDMGHPISQHKWHGSQICCPIKSVSRKQSND